jgi:TM2 domain-containing membrane protein YozV
MTAQGSTGNVLAAIASFFIPGLGQLVQGRALRGLVMLIVTGILWLITAGLGGWIGHIIACYDAAVWKGPKAG